MLMTPEPLGMLLWGEKRQNDGGRRGRAKAEQFKRHRENQDLKATNLALPRRFDAVHAPTYQVPAEPAPMRPGSENFLRVASRGLRC
jgi:hypothetical protein